MDVTQKLHGQKSKTSWTKIKNFMDKHGNQDTGCPKVIVVVSDFSSS